MCVLRCLRQKYETSRQAALMTGHDETCVPSSRKLNVRDRDTMCDHSCLRVQQSMMLLWLMNTRIAKPSSWTRCETDFKSTGSFRWALVDLVCFGSFWFHWCHHKRRERKTSQTNQYKTISINVKRSDGVPVRSVRIICSRSLLLCICIVTRFSFMIMQLLPFRFKSVLAHHFRATRVISQFLGWDASATGDQSMLRLRCKCIGFLE